MPLITPPYDDLPPWSGANYTHTALESSTLKSSANYTLQIDGITGQKRTLHEFLNRVEDAATALGVTSQLGGLGLKASDGFVGIMSENHLDFPVLVYALFKIAVPLTLIPSLVTPAESVALLKLSCISTLFVSPRLLPVALGAAKEIGLSENRIFLLHGRASSRKTLSDLIASVRGVPRVPTTPVKEDTAAYMVFSSGTSGLPKGVLISHRNTETALSQIGALLQRTLQVYQPPTLNTPEGIPLVLAVLPLYHTMGFHAFIVRMLQQPMTYVMLPRWDASQVAEIIPRFKITHIPMVPSMAHQLATSPKLSKVDLSSVVSMNSGAAYLPPDVRERLNNRAKNVPYFSEGYGMSECTVAAIVTPHPGTIPNVTHAPGLTGVLIPGMKARIVRDDGSDADFDEPGELWLFGNNVALGYHNNEKATQETFVNGWLHTGDNFKVDKNGRFFYCDRGKDTLKVSGIQVSPVEIEDTILAHPERLVDDVAVAGVPGARMADERVPRAWIVLSLQGRQKGASYVTSVLDSWVRTRLSRPKWLRGGIEFISEVPKSPTGKVLRRVLQQRYEANALRIGRVRTKL